MDDAAPVVFIVDDDDSVLRSLSRLLRQAGYEPRPHGSARDFLKLLERPLPGPCCLVLDLTMPEMSGLELQRRMAAGEVTCPVIFISGNGSIPETVEAMKRGAITFLVKPFDHGELLEAVAEALGRHREAMAAGARVGELQARIASLTAREREVMRWVVTGALNKQIAAELGIVEKTVKVHRARVYEKMAATSLADLVRLCGAAGFAPA